MNKKITIFAFSAMLFALCLPALAQQPGKLYRIGFVSIRSEPGSWDEAFKLGLRDLGYVEGRNLSILYRWADGDFDRFSALAAELVQLKVDIIVTETTPAAQAAKKATQTIPIVMAIGGDAVGAGLIESLAHPGGNITGQSFLGTDLAGQWVEILKELFPKASRLAFLATSAISPEVGFFKVMQPVAEKLGMTIRFADAAGPKDFKNAFGEMKQARIDGLIVAPNGGFRENRKQIVNLAAVHRLPALYGSREFVEVGGLASYGQNVSEMFRRAAYYVDKIAKGTKPGDLPVERPRKYELLINLKTAKELGLAIPPEVLLRADQVIK